MNDLSSRTPTLRAPASTHGRASGAAIGRASIVLPRAVADATLACLDRAAGALIAVGVSANAITLSGLVFGAAGGVLLGFGSLGPATGWLVLSALADALDGLTARKSGSACARGALLDASADRYEEFFVLGGLAVFFRHSVASLVLALFALVGSFMVSYGSAKAEAFRLPVPPGVMRRAERAVCLCAGVAGSAALATARHDPALHELPSRAPLLVALALVATAANVSAIRRLLGLGLRTARADELAAREAAAPGPSTRVVPARHAWRLP